MVAIIALAVLCLLGVYFGANVYKVFTFRGLKPHKIVFWIVFVLICGTIIYTRSVFLATLLYGIMLFAVGDLLCIALRVSGWQAGANAINTVLQGGLTVLAIALLVTLAAWQNTRNPELTSYQISLDKDFGTFERIEIIMLSDLHLGTATDKRSVDSLVQNVNAQNPDVVALCGDIFDEGTSPALRAYAIEAFGNLAARLGVYYITGNHDSVVTSQDAAAWESVGVTLLLDKTILIEDSFYLVGLSDAGHRGDSASRGEIKELLEGADSSKPIILFDHRPGALESAKAAGVDMQMSGHTHAGQLFPFEKLAELANNAGYGHTEHGDFHIIVSSGYSVWGLPARLGSPCEYVRVTLTPQNGV